MRITVLAIGTRMPSWVEQGVGVYKQRLPRQLELEFRGLSASSKSARGASGAQKDKEGELLLRAIREPSYVIALDEHGSSWTSAELGEQLQDWMATRPNVTLLIGGADGLSDACKQRADHLWSLSPLTLPHALVRVVLAEQIYRAWTLVQGHPYHRD
jgi:23S rRNA (pseudouridine1915-N3)-methyltransferase